MVLQLSAGGLSAAFTSDEQGQEEPPQFQVEDKSQEELEEEKDEEKERRQSFWACRLSFCACRKWA